MQDGELKTYQVRFPLITVAETTPDDAVLRAYEVLGRLLRSGEERAFVNQVIPLEASRRLDVWDQTTRIRPRHDPPDVG